MGSSTKILFPPEVFEAKCKSLNECINREAEQLKELISKYPQRIIVVVKDNGVCDFRYEDHPFVKAIKESYQSHWQHLIDEVLNNTV